jgi:hypothetical protein
MSKAVQDLKKIHPEMFYEASRSALYALKDLLGTKLTFNPTLGQYVTQFDKHQTMADPPLDSLAGRTAVQLSPLNPTYGPNSRMI